MKSNSSKDINDLLNAILSLKDLSEAQRFFRDLLTEKELDEFGKRWRAARLLASSVPYSQIVSNTGLSSTTVARISRWLTNGTGGYQLVIDRMKESLNIITPKVPSRSKVQSKPGTLHRS